MSTAKTERKNSKIKEEKILEINEYHPFVSAEAKEKFIAETEKRVKPYWPENSITKYIDTSFGKTFVRIAGPETAPPLVLLHGFGGGSASWHPNIAALSKSYKTYAVDTIYDSTFSIYTKIIQNADEYAAWLDELFTGLGLKKNINIMGMSYGGWLTSQYALRFQSRVNKIVLLAPAATILPFSKQFVIRATLIFIKPRMFMNSLFSWIFSDLLKKDKKILQSIVDSMNLAGNTFKPRPSLVSPTVLTDSELQSIKVSVLFLIGENEKMYSVKKAFRRLEKLAPAIKKEIIPNAGHDMPVVQADLVNEKVIEFLKE